MTEEGVPIAKAEAPPCIIPDFDIPQTEEWDMKPMPRTAVSQARLQTDVEIQEIQSRLARPPENADAKDKSTWARPISVGVLRDAMMIPEEIEFKETPGERKYPDPGHGLMVNPFPKPKKKGKKGKKGKKK